MSFIDQYPTGVARYSSEAPEFSSSSKWNFWQCGNRGKVEGIYKEVDLNVFSGDLLELENFCISEGEICSTVKTRYTF